jgi:hypothetical protein
MDRKEGRRPHRCAAGSPPSSAPRRPGRPVPSVLMAEAAGSRQGLGGGEAFLRMEGQEDRPRRPLPAGGHLQGDVTSCVFGRADTAAGAVAGPLARPPAQAVAAPGGRGPAGPVSPGPLDGRRAGTVRSAMVTREAGRARAAG